MAVLNTIGLKRNEQNCLRIISKYQIISAVNFCVFISKDSGGGDAELESDDDPDQMSIYEQKNRRRRNIQQETSQGNYLNFTRYS